MKAIAAIIKVAKAGDLAAVGGRRALRAVLAHAIGDPSPAVLGVALSGVPLLRAVGGAETCERALRVRCRATHSRFKCTLVRMFASILPLVIVVALFVRIDITSSSSSHNAFIV